MKKGVLFGLFFVALLAYVNRRVKQVASKNAKRPDPYEVEG